MKKLLAILGSIGMVSSWTTFVIACKGNSTVEKLNLTIFDTALGIFEDEPSEQQIIDAFNAKNSESFTIALTLEDVTITNKTSTGAIIKANLDSTLYTGSANITFIVKIHLNTYEKIEFTIKNQNPSDQEVLNEFNKANNVNLILITDVTIKIKDKKATITATSESQKVKGEVIVSFSSKWFLSNLEWGPFKYLDNPPDEINILELINEANSNKFETKLTQEEDLEIYLITERGARVKAREKSKKVIGYKDDLKFGYKDDLSKFDNDGIEDNQINFGPQNAQPKQQNIFDQFIAYIANIDPKLKLELNTDIIIEQNLITKTEAIIKTNPKSQKVKGELKVIFTIKTNLNTYKSEIIEKFNNEPTDQEVLDAFYEINKPKAKLYLKKDVEIINKNKTEATIKALEKSPDYTGEIKVKFSIKINIKIFFEKITDLEIKDNKEETILLELKAKNSKLNPNLVEIDKWSITEKSAKIKPKDNINYTGEIEITFRILPYPNDNRTWYINKDNNDEPAVTVGSAPAGTTEVLQIGYDQYGEAYKMPESILKVPDQISPKITSLYKLFDDCAEFVGNDGNISNWDISNVTNIAAMFMGYKTGAWKFNGDLSKWNTSNVTQMNSIFRSAKSFNQPLNDWDTSKVTNMSQVFWGAESFDQPLNKWDVSKVTDMDRIFGDAITFNQNLSSWDVSKVQKMGLMFQGSSYRDKSKFNNGGSKLNWGNKTSNVTDMNHMFDGAKSFNHDISDWNVAKVKEHKDFAKDGHPEFIQRKWPKFKN